MKKAIVTTFTAAALLVSTAAPAWAFDRRFATFTIKSVTNSDLMRVVIKLALVAEQSPPADCKNRVPVRVQRRVNGRWVTKGKGRTNRRGRLIVELPDRAGRYRGVAPEFTTDAGNQCFESISAPVTHQPQ